jgi:hypothetical protein
MTYLGYLWGHPYWRGFGHHSEGVLDTLRGSLYLFSTTPYPVLVGYAPLR